MCWFRRKQAPPPIPKRKVVITHMRSWGDTLPLNAAGTTCKLQDFWEVDVVLGIAPDGTTKVLKMRMGNPTDYEVVYA